MLPIEIVEVARQLEQRRFFALPRRLGLAGLPGARELRVLLDPLRNPLLRHTDVWLYLAQRGGRPAGRVALFLDVDRGAGTAPRPARFGLLAAEDDPRIFRALVETCAEEACRRGHLRLIGPCGPALLDAPGIWPGLPSSPPLAAPLLPDGGGLREQIAGDLGLTPSPCGAVLDVALAPRRWPRRRRSRGLRVQRELGPLFADAALVVAAARSRTLERAPFDLLELRAARAEITARAVVPLCDPRPHPADDGIRLLALATRSGARSAHQREATARLIRRLGRTPADALLHLIVLARPACRPEAVAETITVGLERAHDAGYERAAVTVACDDPASEEPALALAAAVRALPSGADATLRTAVLLGRAIARAPSHGEEVG